jgi:hypothetical protein
VPEKDASAEALAEELAEEHGVLREEGDAECDADTLADCDVVGLSEGVAWVEALSEAH